VAAANAQAMNIFVFLHIIFVIVAFGLTTGVGVVMAAVGRSADPRAIRIAVKAGLPMSMTGGALLLLGAIFGFGAAGTLGIPTNAPWLIAAYIMTLLLLLMGFLVFVPWQRRLLQAAASCADDRPSPELVAVANEKAPGIAGPISGILWLLLIYVMVAKP
jgi:hypothetical protein